MDYKQGAIEARERSLREEQSRRGFWMNGKGELPTPERRLVKIAPETFDPRLLARYIERIVSVGLPNSDPQKVEVIARKIVNSLSPRSLERPTFEETPPQSEYIQPRLF